MLKRNIFIIFLFLSFSLSNNVFSSPIIDQTGNLAINGNFESGTTEWITTDYGVGAPSAFTNWDQYTNSGTVSTQLATDPLFEGDYTGHIIGNAYNGTYQYTNRSADTYTLSGWIYAVTGSAHLGIAWNSGSSSNYSNPTASVNMWEYVVLTETVNSSWGGPLIYAASDNSDFYVEGVWYNLGPISESPFDPSTGFNPNVPIPSSIILLISGLIGIGEIKRKFKD